MLQTSLPLRYEDYTCSISDTKSAILAEKMHDLDSLPCGYPYDHICPIQVCKEQGGEEWYQHRKVRITASNAHQVVHLKSGAAITTFLNKSLNQSNVGCHFYSICVNHLFYADDSGYCTSCVS